jgi:hypothetical protein
MTRPLLVCQLCGQGGYTTVSMLANHLIATHDPATAIEDPDPDPISCPKHYTHGKIQPIDVIEDWKLGFRLGQVLKYVARCDHKGTALQDLKKAAWYLAREIAKREAGE